MKTLQARKVYKNFYYVASKQNRSGVFSVLANTTNHNTKQFCTVIALALLIPMSYHFGEPLSFHTSHRLTDKVNLINKKEFSYVNEGKTLIKKTCLQDELFDPKSEDIIGTTGGTTVYFVSGSLSVTSSIATTHLEEYKERLLQTWMPVNAKVKHEDVLNKDLIQWDIFCESS